MNGRRACGFVILLLLPLLGAAQQQQTTPPTVDDIETKFSVTVVESSFGSTSVTNSWLRGEIYFLEPQTLALPKFEKLKPVGTVYTNGLNIPPREFTKGFPGITDRFEWFAIDYKGKFYVAKGAKYQFVLVSDDGSKLYIDGHVVIDLDGHHPPLRKEGSVHLKPGMHDIRVSYFQGPRFSIALMFGVRRPGDHEWRVFNIDEFKPPPSVSPNP
jgi:hypothetical protein